MFLDDFNATLSITLFGLTLLIELYIFIRVRFTLDKAAWCISIAYLLSIMLRTPLFPETNLNLVHATASMMIWGSLYFFTFEMRKFEDKLKSNSFEEEMGRAKKTQKA